MYSFRSLPSLLLAGVLTLGPAAAMHAAGNPKGASIDYTVAPDIKGESFHVTASLHNITGDTLTFYFPIWAPGAYDIVNFGGFVRDFVATGKNGHPLTVVRADTNTFRIIGAKEAELKIVYNVHDIESVPNSLWFGLSDIEPTYAFAVGTAMFGYPAGFKDIPYTVDYQVPSSWDIAIGLDPLAGSGKHAYRARNYDELVDAPLQMGKFQRLEFTVQGKPHVITITSDKPFSDSLAKAYVDMTKKVIGIETGFFGDMPYNRYVFQQYLVTPQRGEVTFGALEHANSSTYRMPYLPEQDITAEMAPTVAHEFWHLWSPKRIHVRQLGPFDYQNPPRTKSLWFAEGLTEYYARLLLVRNGMTPMEDYLAQINSFITPSYGQPQSRSMTELSMQIAELGPSESGGLYTKGPVLGLLLDAAIRSQTGNKKSLDDAMRYFNQKYGVTGESFSDDEIIPIIERVTGAKLQEFYNSYIDGHMVLPYAELLPKIGLKIEKRVEKKATIGAEMEQGDGGWRVASVAPGGTADSTGLRAGDFLTSLFIGSGTQSATLALKDIPAAAVDQVMEQLPTFLPAELTLMRDGRELKLPVKYQIGNVEIRSAAVDNAASTQARMIRKSMFGV